MVPGQLFFVVFGALGVGLLLSPDEGSPVFGGLMLVVCIALLGRSISAPAVGVTRQAVYLRGLYRTQVVPISRVSHADVIQSNDGISWFQKEYLQLTLTSGERVIFTGLKTARSVGGPPSFVTKAARRINALIEVPQV